MHPRRRTVPKTKSALTAITRSGTSSMETARMVPTTRAIMQARVNAAAPSTAAMEAMILNPTPVLAPPLAFGLESGHSGMELVEQKLVQARPVVGHQNRIAGIGGIVFHAGRLPGSDALEAQTLFEPGDVLRGFVRDPCNRIAVAH